MDPTLEKLFRDTAGQALFNNALDAGIKMSIGKFYDARREWVASQSLSGSEAETTPGEPDERASPRMLPLLEQMINNITMAATVYDDLESAMARGDHQAVSAALQILEKCCVKVVET